MESSIKVIQNDKYIGDIKRTILSNRGIKDIEGYLNPTSKCLNSYELLGEDNLERAYQIIEDGAKNRKNMVILVDTDVDGYCSSAIIYSYLKSIYNVSAHVILNKGKTHGLTEEIVSGLISSTEKNGGVLIIPDAGTNDYEYCKQLSDYYDIIVLDHHEKEFDNPYAVIINPQTSEYPNKSLCGTAVVYKFVQYLDDILFESESQKYSDLVAVAMIADVMDLREIESRYLVTYGLQRIYNKLIKAIINKNSFSISNTEIPNTLDVTFYVVPLMNACIRIGSEEEKQKLFNALIEEDNGVKYEYLPRKSKNNPDPKVIFEDLYSYVARSCSNLKSKQDRQAEKIAGVYVEAFKDNKSKLLAIDVSDSDFDKEITGYIANKICNTLKRPVMLLRMTEGNDGKILYSGSARNYNNSYVESLKDEIVNSGLSEKALGHSSAFGVTIEEDNIEKLVEYFNEKYKMVNTTKTYYVDFSYQNEVPYSVIRDIDEMKSLFSSFVNQPYVAVSDIYMKANEISLLKSDNGNKRFVFTVDDVEYVKFKLPDNDSIANLLPNLNGNETLKFTIMVGKTSINKFAGNVTPQYIIDDYTVEIIDNSDSYDEDEDW